MKQEAFIVTGMSCAACSARVEKVVSALPGMQQVQLNLLTGRLRVQYDERLLQRSGIVTAVEQAGYGVSPATDTPATGGAADVLKRRFQISLIFLIPLMLLHHLAGSSLCQLLQGLLLLPILWLNRAFFISGTRALRQHAPNMDSLIVLGAGAGLLYTAADTLLLHTGASYLESTGMILTLITLGKWMEKRATAHTGDALSRLKAMLPRQATVLRGGKACTVEATGLQPGDSLLIQAGARIPADAIVTGGVSSIDESSLTGESMPVVKEQGCTLYAGTINGTGILKARVLCRRDESALCHIIQLVGEAGSTKAPIARLADRLSGIFVPVVMGIALATVLLWLIWGMSLSFALGCGIAVLVISCPCALGLATPVAIMTGAGTAAASGILFRDAATMENARRTTAVILDKTGTLTAGRPIITSIAPAPGVTKDELLQLAATLEQFSSHPLAQSVRKASADYTPTPCEQARDLPGKGICGIVQGVRCLAGNAALLQEHGIGAPLPDSGGMTPLYFARGQQFIGMIGATDPLKDDSAAAVAAMQQAGLRVIMMSGDQLDTVRKVARRTGIQEYHAGVLPQDKEAMVRQLQSEGHCVAMVGDGINDAPALMRADVGIAIGAGTDVALESAGIILTGSDLGAAVTALQLSRAVIRTIRQNLFWAFFYNALAIPLAAGLYYPLTGWQLTPGIAAAAMSLSSLCVVANALRLRHFTPTLPPPADMNTICISVQGMMCPHCERHVTQALCALPGISDVQADCKKGTVTLTTSVPVDEERIAVTLQQAGYEYKGRC